MIIRVCLLCDLLPAALDRADGGLLIGKGLQCVHGMLLSFDLSLAST